MTKEEIQALLDAIEEVDNEECHKCGSNNIDFIGDELKCCDCGYHWIND